MPDDPRPDESADPRPDAPGDGGLEDADTDADPPGEEVEGGSGDEDLRVFLAGAVSLHLQVFAALCVLVAVVTAVVARSSLDGREWPVIGLVLVGSVAAWRWPGGWPGALIMSVAGAAGFVLCTAALVDRERADPLAVWTVGDRLLGRDVAPTPLIMGWVATACLALTGLALALPWRLPVASLGPYRQLAAATAALMSCTAVPALVVGADIAHDRLHRESEDLHRRLDRYGSARRVDEPRAVPPQPTTLRWVAGGVGADVVAVPGWDAAIALHAPALGATSVSALSVEDGAALWTYRRLDGSVTGAAVDPEAGRVLIVADEALLVLDLADGSEVAVRRSPVGATSELFGDRLADVPLVLGPTVVLTSGQYEEPGRVALVDVATGAARGSAGNPHWECDYARTSDSAPTVLRWGPGRGCREPTLLAADPGGGDLVEVGRVQPPDGAWAGCTGEGCARTRLVGDASSATLALAWNSLAPERPVVEEVVHLVDGDLAWRVPVTGDRAAADPAGGAALVPGSGDDGPVAEWGGTWRRLAAADGAETARSAVTAADDLAAVGSQAVVSGGRVYTVQCGTLVVRGNDLAPEGTWPLAADDCVREASVDATGPDSRAPYRWSTTQATSTGLLLVHDRERATLFAYGAPVPGAVPPHQPAAGR